MNKLEFLLVMNIIYRRAAAVNAFVIRRSFAVRGKTWRRNTLMH